MNNYDNDKDICTACGGRYGLHNHMNKRCPMNINASMDHTEYRETVFTTALPASTGEGVKEKAEELYNKFEKIFIDANADSWGNEAKQCALICVDEIYNWLEIDTTKLNEWKSIKEAINKL